MFSSEFCVIFKNTFYYRTPAVAASVSSFKARKYMLKDHLFRANKKFPEKLFLTPWYAHVFVCQEVKTICLFENFN